MTEIDNDRFLSGRFYGAVNNNDNKGLKGKIDSYGVDVKTLKVDFSNINANQNPQDVEVKP